MPDQNNQAVNAALIAGGAQIASQGLNYAAQSSINKKTREWNETMYGRQREDALADWARTNEYNSPINQMKRLREAGLNPHLVYGGGANSVSAPVRGTDVKGWNPQAPAFDLGGIVNTYFGVKQQAQALENQEAQLRLINANIDKTDAETAAKLSTNPYLADEIKSRINNRNVTTENLQLMGKLAMNKDQREALRATQDLEIGAKRVLEIGQNIAKSKQELQNLRSANELLIQNGEMRKLEVMQKRLGLDNDYSQVEWILAQAMEDPLGTTKKLQRYIEALGYLATSGAKQTGKTISETAKAFYESIFGK